MIYRWLLLSATLLLMLGASVACGPECPEGQTKCGEVCINTKTDRANCGACGTKCEAGQVCNDGKCAVSCQKDLTNCEGSCINAKTDPQNCGECGTKCKTGELCTEGKCELSCPSGQKGCDGSCIDTDSDPKNCGDCGTKCKDGEVCNSGKCELTCNNGLTDCNGTCVNTKAERAHCGACDTKCKDGEVCNGGKCAVSCQKDLTDCSGSCINTQTDFSNCGKCGTACKSGEICKAGKCELNCQDGYGNCKGSCIDLQNSSANCGACDTKCGQGEICKAGKCELSCETGQTACGKLCVNVQADGKNCGTCGTACSKGEVCQSGKCIFYCQKGFTECSKSCVDIKNNNANCGACGTACAKGEVCAESKCIKPCADGSRPCAGACINYSSDVKNCGTCGNACTVGQVCLSSKCTTCTDCPNWASKWGSFDEDEVKSIAVDSSGNIYATGFFANLTSINGAQLKSFGGDDILIVKLSPAGKIMWAKHAGGTGNDYGYSISVDKGGNAYVTGSFNGSATFGTIGLTSAGSNDIFVAKLEKDGKWGWAKSFGGTSSDYGYGIAVDGTGNAYITGRMYSSVAFGSTTLTSAGGADIFVAKLDNTGKVSWAKRAGGTGSSDEGKAIALDSKGNVYVAGSFYTTSAKWGTTTLSSTGGYDIFVGQIDATGKFGWAATAGGSSSDYAYALAIDSKDNIYVTGRFSSSSADFGTTKLTSKGRDDIFAAKLDNTGKWGWAVSGGGGSYDYGYGIGVDSKGTTYITGYFSGAATFGKTILQAKGNDDIFLVQIDPTGKIVGGTSIGGAGDDTAYALTVDSNDNIYLGGYFEQIANFGKTKLITSGDTDAFIAKYTKPAATFCPTTGKVCGGVCLDVSNDNANCGACGTLCQAGQVCGGGKCLSPPTTVYIQEFNTNIPDYVALKNYGTTDVQLSGLWIYVNRKASFSGYDAHQALPSFTLKAGATVFLPDGNAKTGEILVTKNILTSSGDDFVVLLCFGKCDAAKSNNVLDALFVGSGVPLPTGVTFTGTQAKNSNDSTNSYVRSTTTGKNPTFTASDWTIGPKTRP